MEQLITLSKQFFKFGLKKKSKHMWKVDSKDNQIHKASMIIYKLR
jgi:hypothetical protein